MGQWLRLLEPLLGAGGTCFHRAQGGGGVAQDQPHVWPLFPAEDVKNEDQVCSGVDPGTELPVGLRLEKLEEEEEADAQDQPVAALPAQKSHLYLGLLQVSHHRWGQDRYHLTPTLQPPPHPGYLGEVVNHYSSPASVPEKDRQADLLLGQCWAGEPWAERSHEYEANDFSIPLESSYSYVL